MSNISMSSSISTLLVSLALLLSAGLSNAQTSAASSVQGKTDILWLGQAGFRIKTPGGKIILIDPWITGGPKTPSQYKNDLAAIGPIDP